ncbi:MAG: hypothetical protein ABIH04_02960 [Planctomycetota bacterium]
MEKARATKTGSRWFVPLSLTVIAVAAILPYVSSWSNSFVADDWAHLMYSRLLTPSKFVENCSFSHKDYLYRPVAIGYFYLNYFLWGDNPVGHHAFKGLLFAASSVVLFLFLLKATGLRIAALTAGLIFALHPLNVSCAIYQAAHANVLCVFFYLLALLLFVLMRKRRRAGISLYAGFLFAMLLSFGSYELGYTLPAVVILADLLLVRRPERERLFQTIRRGWRLHVPYLLVAVVFFAARFSLMTNAYKMVPVYGAEYFAALKNMVEVLFLPVGRFELPAPVWQRLLPALAGLLLLLWVLIRGRGMRLPAVFAVMWCVVAIIPIAGDVNPVSAMENVRFLATIVPAFGLLIGLFAQSFWGKAPSRIVVGLCLAAILTGLLVVNLKIQSRWAEESSRVKSMVETVYKTVAGEPLPYRLVFVTYPPSPPGAGLPDPLFISYAVLAKIPLANSREITARITSPYAVVQIPEEVRRWLPVRLNGDWWREYDIEREPRISRQDLNRTFFFYWRDRESVLVDCTETMRKRLAKPRECKLFEWTADRAFPHEVIITGNCSYNVNKEQKLVYIAPNLASSKPVIIEINLAGIRSKDFDSIDIELSAASKSYEEGFFTAGLTWLWEGEALSPATRVERLETFQGRYFEFHKMYLYSVPLAHRFWGSEDRKVDVIYIELPCLPELAIRSIRLTRFDD